MNGDGTGGRVRGRDDGPLNPPRAGGPHPPLQVRRDAEHQVRAPGDDALKHPVDTPGYSPAWRRVVHRDHEARPPLGAGEHECQDRKRPSPQPVRMHHVAVSVSAGKSVASRRAEQ